MSLASCQICIHPITEPCKLKACGHVFCYSCIHQWIGTNRIPLCPVCRAAIEGRCLILADGSAQEAEPSTQAHAADADLSCLDHGYFIQEVSRLLSRANSVHDRLFQQAYGCGRKGSNSHTQRMLESVQEVVATLSSYRSSLEGEVRFDPEVLLTDLYRLDQQLNLLSTGGIGRGALPLPSEATPPFNVLVDSSRQHPSSSHDEHRQHHGEEYDDYADAAAGNYHDDDDDEDDWHPSLSRGGAVSRTPGRRPTSRHKRSNSVPQQQRLQHQQQQQGSHNNR